MNKTKIFGISTIILLIMIALSLTMWLSLYKPNSDASTTTFESEYVDIVYDNTYGNVTSIDAEYSGNTTNRDVIIYSFTFELNSAYQWGSDTSTCALGSTFMAPESSEFTRNGNVWSPSSGTLAIQIGDGPSMGDEHATITFPIADLVEENPNATTYEGIHIDINYDGSYGEVASVEEDYSASGGIHNYRYVYINSFTFNLNSNYQWTSDNASFYIYGGMSGYDYYEFERVGNVWTPTAGSLSFLLGDGPGGDIVFSLSKGSVYAATGGEYVTLDFPVADLVEEVSTTLTFDPAGGSVTPTTMQVSNGEAIGTLPTPTREGFIFDGWYVDGVEINSGDIWSYSTDKTAIAQWIEIFTLTLDANGGSVSQNAIDVINGQSIGTLPTPTRSGYRFAGWYIGDTLISLGDTWSYSADQTATAHWVQQFTLTICSNNTEFGIVTNEVSNQLFDAQSVVQSYGVGNIGFALLYWQDDLGNKIYENPLNITLTRNSTYTAVFGKAVELNGICAVDINLLNDDTTLAVVGTVSMNGYTTETGLSSVHLSAVASKGYQFEYWTVDGQILTYDGTTPYTAVCDIPLELVQGKIVVANFSQIDNSNVNDDTNN